MSDDVYGHSVEDHDMAVSPTTGRTVSVFYYFATSWIPVLGYIYHPSFYSELSIVLIWKFEEKQPTVPFANNLLVTLFGQYS